MTITLLGEPKSTSHIYHYTCRGRFPSMYMTAQGKALKTDYQWQARSQFKGEPLKGPLEIDVTLFHGIKRVSDWDNFHKLSQDALSGIVWDDDSQVIDAHVHKRYDKAQPRIVITITKHG